jgi:hypothetical protein
MAAPAWIQGVLAALMLTIAAVSAARLAATRPRRRSAVVADIDVAHLLMAIAMAGMLAAGLAIVPSAAWQVIFGLLTIWLAFRVCRDVAANGIRALAGGHCAPHLVHAAAMLYMFAALTAPAAEGPRAGGMGGPAMRTLQYPALAFVFALILAGYSVWDLDRLSGRRYSLAGAGLRPAAVSVPAALAGPGSAIAALAGLDAPAGAATPHPVAVSVGETVPADSGPDSGPAARMVLLSPGVTVGCRIAIGVTMAFLLVIMI